MSQIVPFTTASGVVVYVESTDSERPRAMPASRKDPKGANLAEQAGETFDAAMAKVKPAAEAVVEAFRELNHPAEIGLEFGLKLSKKLDAFVISGDAEASFKLSLTWKNPPRT